MPFIEYSPSSRAKCQGCYSKITMGCVRVGVSVDSGYHRRSGREYKTEYYHAGCYHNRKDFEKFRGFHQLKQEDQMKYALPINKTTSIKNLNPNLGKRWRIQATITNKSDIRHWNNSRGTGSLFHIELIDDSDMDIRATFFKEACDKFYNKLQVGKKYMFAGGGTVKDANQQYNPCKSKYEITFNEHTDIKRCKDTNDAKKATLNITKLSDLRNVTQPTKPDILACVARVSTIIPIPARGDKKETIKREIILIDNSGYSVMWSLWDEKALKPPTENSMVGIFHATLSSYRGLSLTSGIWKEVPPTKALSLANWWSTNRETALMKAQSLTEIIPSPSPSIQKQNYEVKDVGKSRITETPIIGVQSTKITPDEPKVNEYNHMKENTDEFSGKSQVPHQYNFTKLAALRDLKQEAKPDILAVVGHVSDVTKSPGTTETTRRDITLVDNSGYSIIWSLLDDNALKPPPTVNTLIAIRHAHLSSSRGLSLYSGIWEVMKPVKALSLANWWAVHRDTALTEAHSLTEITPSSTPSSEKLNDNPNEMNEEKAKNDNSTNKTVNEPTENTHDSVTDNVVPPENPKTDNDAKKNVGESKGRALEGKSKENDDELVHALTTESQVDFEKASETASQQSTKVDVGKSLSVKESNNDNGSNNCLPGSSKKRNAEALSLTSNNPTTDKRMKTEDDNDETTENMVP